MKKQTDVSTRLLMRAISTCDLEKIKKIIAENECDLNYTGYDTTALIQAVYTGRPDIVEFLIKNGASPNTVVYVERGKLGEFYAMFSIFEAIYYSTVEVVEMLLKYNADLSMLSETQHKGMIVHLTEDRTTDNIVLLKMLIDAGLKLDSSNKNEK